MSEPERIDINILHHIVLREIESDDLQELDPLLYPSLSEFMGNLRGQEFDGVEDKIKDAQIEMAAELTSLLTRTRLEKMSKPGVTSGRLLDEEKFIIDSHEEQEERTGMILNATINGKSKLLESIATSHKKPNTPNLSLIHI